MKLLFHICCAPCLIYPLESLRAKGFEVVGLFCNSNIHPLSEYKMRRQAVEALSQSAGVEVLYAAYEPQEFFRAVNMREAIPGRCAICWELRLRQTAKIAKEKGIPYFSTTLLVSPYQDQERLKTIGTDIGLQEAVDFYYEDFRPGFREAHNKARAQGIYCQKYCGCLYSELERSRIKKKSQGRLTKVNQG